MKQIRRYCLDPLGDEVVERHLSLLSQTLLRECPEMRALILIGSFGRGEGATTRNESGQILPLNDYDLVVVSEQKLPFRRRRVLKELSYVLADMLDIWHVDLIPMSAEEFRCPSVSMLRFDMKYASTVIIGGEHILDQIPYSRESKIPNSEIENLILNRMLSLLEGYPCTRNLPPPHQARQIAKAVYAVVDATLIRHESYRPRYAEKRESLELLNGKLSDLTSLSFWASQAWRYQLDPADLREEPLLHIWDQVRLLLLQVFYELHQIPRTAALSQLFPKWRCRKAPSLLNLLTGRPPKSLIEQKIACFLHAYPDRRWIPELHLEVPAAFSQGHISKEWLLVQKELILNWYNAQ